MVTKLNMIAELSAANNLYKVIDFSVLDMLMHFKNQHVFFVIIWVRSFCRPEGSMQAILLSKFWLPW